MKTKKNWFVIVAAMIMSSVMIFASCSSDDDPMLPEVIESEVLDKGMDDTASSKPSINPNGVTTGTQFSYKSWIMVKGQTRAAFENKVEVTLNGGFENVEETCSVNHWDVGQAETIISHTAEEQRHEGFVTITDSVLIYTVRMAEFSFDYRLNYEVGVYDDGITRQEMPCYRYGKIIDNGGVLETADSYVDGTIAYARRIYRHSITVEFGGKSHEVAAEITLRRELGQADKPYILRSRLLEQTLTKQSENAFLAAVDVRSVWSNGNEKTQRYTAELPFVVERFVGEEITVHGSKDDVVLQNALIERTGSSFEEGGECMTLERIEKKCILHYNLFTLTIPLIRYEALFDNILLQEKLGAYTYDAKSVTVTEMNWRLEEESGNKKHYFLSACIRLNIGEVSVDGFYDGWVVFIKD